MTGLAAQPADFRDRLRMASGEAEPGRRVRALVALAQHDLGYLETIQLDKVLARVAGEDLPDLVRVRLALLASATIDHLLPAIRIAGLRRGLWIEIYTGPFGQYRQELLDPGSGLHRFRPDTVVLSPSAREAIAGIALGASADEADHQLRAAVAELCGLWRRVRGNLGATIIQQSFLDTLEPLFGSYERMVPGAPSRLVGRMNELLAEAVLSESVLWLDVAASAARDGIREWFDVARWLQGKMEIAPGAAGRYAELLTRLVAAQRGRSRKCMVLDLDNTLWGGLIGDDGVEGIVLGEGNAEGEAYLAFQRYARKLGERGVILAVCSKNDAAIVEAAFREHPEMHLRREDIAAFAVNWSDKAENLRSIAAQLNIGLDSLVFVDDNPAERARIRESLPMVAVPELPSDPAHYVACLADAGYFEAVALTREDLTRTAAYAADAAREGLRETAQDIEEYLRGLDMTVSCGAVTALDLPRVVQLVNKTNQFNPTTRRYSSEEMARLCEDPANLTLQFRLRDRFGDHGLVSAILLRPLAGETDVLEIEFWVMSCRVFGRQLEHEAMNVAVEMARARGHRAFRADYLPTARNGVVSGLYGALGFTQLEDSGMAPGASRWGLELAGYASHETFLCRDGRL